MVILRWSIGFLIGFAADLMWARYIPATAEHRQLAAAWWSVLIYAAGVAATYLVMEGDWIAMLGCAAGAWTGTYRGTRRPNGKT